MCFTKSMSAFLAMANFALAAYEWKNFKCLQYSLGLAYWGVMEVLQLIQHFYAASPEDNYAMCQNNTNILITEVTMLHLIFQPVFICMLLMGLYRRHDITARIEADLIWNMSFFFGLWFCWPYVVPIMLRTRQDLAQRGTERCPNYDWLQIGYDGILKQATPDWRGMPCTYHAPTKTGHLAWTFPMPKTTYFLPGTSLHFFLFFVPYLVMFKRPLLQLIAVLFLFTGPVLTAYITPSLHERPSLWCVYSVVEAAVYVLTVRIKGLHNQLPQEYIHHEGGRGEYPLTYRRVLPADNMCTLEDEQLGTPLTSNKVDSIPDNNEHKESLDKDE